VIVGIEGPVLAGKSSLLEMVVPALSASGVDCLACPCYVEVCAHLGRELPPGLPRSLEEQLAARRFFLELDTLRRPDRDPEVLLLDRTAWTLQAHLHSLLAMGAFENTSFNDDAGTALAVRKAMPDALVYLDVPWDTQIERSATNGALPAPFLDRAFNHGFRAYFQETQDVHQALWLDATQPLTRTADVLLDHIRDLWRDQSHPGRQD
jgi:thymidylate kinase